MLRKIKAAYIALLSLASITSSSALDSIEEFTKKFQHGTSNEERLQLCADALSHKLIHNGLSASFIEKVFGEDRIDDYGAPRQLTVYLSGPYEYAWGWRLFFEIDETAKISAISLSDIDLKHKPDKPVPSRDLLIDFSKKYKGAKTDKERFQICLDAIKKGIIRDGAPLSDIKEVFGEPWKEEDTPDNRHFVSIPLSQKSNGWRLCVQFAGKSIFYYYVTNVDRIVYPY